MYLKDVSYVSAYVYWIVQVDKLATNYVRGYTDINMDVNPAEFRIRKTQENKNLILNEPHRVYKKKMMLA